MSTIINGTSSAITFPDATVQNSAGLAAGGTIATGTITTLTTTTLSDGTNSTSTTNCIQGSAKAWVNFNGTVATPSTIRSSYNVSSITKNNTGDWTVNITNALTDANFAVVVTLAYTNSQDHVGGNHQVIAGGNPLTSTTAAVTSIIYNGNWYDSTTVSVACFR